MRPVWWDEDFFFYGEDLDLCYRIKEAGYKLVVLQIGKQGSNGAEYSDAWYNVTRSGNSLEFATRGAR